ARSRLTEAVLALVGAVARVRPLLIAVEDTQWLDGPSLALVAVLATRVADGELTGTMLVTTSRHPAPPAAAETLALAPLSKEDVRVIVEETVGRGVVPDELFARAATLSRGNGFFITELLKLLVDRELLVRRGEGWACDEAALAAAPLPGSAA